MSSFRETCFFGTKCYRKNPRHFQQYSHSVLEGLLREKPVSDESIIAANNGHTPVEVVREQLYILSNIPLAAHVTTEEKLSLIQMKISLSEPFRMFLTKVKDSKDTHKAMDSVFFTELLHPSLGKVKKTCQINFMVDKDFLLMGYEVNKIEDLPMLILYGEDDPGLNKANLPRNITSIKVKSQFPYGKHHTKMMIIVYDDDSVRVIVLTANMVPSDWENRTQGLWISPRCKCSGDPRDSPTEFKKDLLKYLKFYDLSALKPFIDVISKCDFFDVNVFFISSVPGSHKNFSLYDWGHLAAQKRLKDSNCNSDNSDWPVIIQCSSIGSLGPSEDKWVTSNLVSSLSSSASIGRKHSLEFKVIYPSESDVLSSYDGPLGGACLPYSSQTHSKQIWLRKYLHHWRSTSRSRNSSMPHIKTYTCLSHDDSKCSYFLLTSSNLSKAAWGSLNKAGDSLLIMSYEAGVLFTPKHINGGEVFEGKDLISRLLPYDTPLQKYRSPSDEPWFYDQLSNYLG
ncbi:probable tyrosyl-DNA phosphodiesterase [Lepeophtheirus salmonis]|uniref:probable tyrosyl-DNA phosphodiesterase n=1 Tax=Lepeophtheirus salmonis TaxID=72036 RepID=UPI001AE6222F|nr:probable tyrosyl-DNA phosphodiesterase [Lepeophtheirus salmonis]